MTSESISIYYKWLSFVTLALSVILPKVLIEGSIGEKLWIGLLMNGQFHLAYQGLSRLPFRMYQQIESFSPQKTGVRKMFLFMSLFMMIGPIFPLINLVKSAISDHKYEQLMVIMTFLAIFLGAYSLNLKLREVN